MLRVCFVVYICVLHLFCTDYQYLYWYFCTVIHSYCPVLIYRLCMQCHYSCHTAITSYCHHITLPSHHTAITSHCHQTILPWLTSRYLMRAARLLQPVTRLISGRASMLCCCCWAFSSDPGPVHRWKIPSSCAVSPGHLNTP